MHIGARSVIFFPIALLLLLALITFWINKTVQPLPPKLDGSSRHDPDYVMNNFVTTQTDLTGNLRYKLAAVEMKHYPDDDTTQLQRPRYTQFAVGKPYTQVEGLRGYVSSNGEEVELVDNVTVRRQAFAGKGEMTVETDYLKILPNEEYVSTASPVVIRQAPETVIYATGMIYEKKKRTVTLLHKVRAHYVRPPVNKNTKLSSVKSEKKATQNMQNKSEKETSLNTNNARIRRRYE